VVSEEFSVRYKLTIAYRGANYYGWQKQMPVVTWKGPKPPPGEGIPTIQEILSKKIAGVIGHPITLVGSSRTDSGVHAKGQVAHFDTYQTHIPPEGMRRSVNYRLPADILIRSIEAVPDSFDAISSTVCKRYQYFVWNAPDRNPLIPDICWHRWQPLDVEAMIEAAKVLVGEHDFTSFCKPGHHRVTTVRAVQECRVSKIGPKLVIGVAGNGFLWNMVRIMVGTLVEVGLGHHTPADVSAMLAARDRRVAGATAPPEGLFLQWIKFNADCLMPIAEL